MKRFFLFALTLLFLLNLNALSSWISLGGSFGHYSVADPIYKDLYGSGNFIYGGFLTLHVFSRLELRGDAGYFKDIGETSLTEERTEFSLVPIALGLRYKLIKGKIISPYLGAGANLTLFKEKARIGDTSDSTNGFHLEGGIYIALGKRFHFDLNLRYIVSDAEPYDETIKLGGYRTEIAAGYSF